MSDKPENKPVRVTEGQSKGGQNPPDPGSKRPPAPQGSGGQSAQNSSSKPPDKK